MAAENETGKSSYEPEYIKGVFRNKAGTEALEITRPSGMTYPVGVRVRWRTEGEGRAALNQMLATVIVLELDHVARAAAEGKKFHLEPLREIGKREGWQLDSQLEGNPAKYSLRKDNEDTQHTGQRSDLLLALELAVRCAIKPFEKQTELPSWVERARRVYPLLVSALEGEPVFEAKEK